MQHPPSRFTELLKNIPSLLGLDSAGAPPSQIVTVLDDGVEIRRHPPLVLAQVTLAGSHDDVVRRARNRIDRYLDGESTRGSPVARTSELRRRGFVGGWTVSRVLRADRIDDLPRPHVPDLRLVQLPEQTVAAFPYRGDHDEHREDARARLLDTLRREPDQRVAGPVYWASLDTASPLAFGQRDEARVELDPGAFADRVVDEPETWSLSWLAANMPFMP
jgi:hypothetical protein